MITIGLDKAYENCNLFQKKISLPAIPMKTVRPKQTKNTTNTRTKCRLDSVYNRIGVSLQEAKESTELAGLLEHVFITLAQNSSKGEKKKRFQSFFHKKIKPNSEVTLRKKTLMLLHRARAIIRNY